MDQPPTSFFQSLTNYLPFVSSIRTLQQKNEYLKKELESIKKSKHELEEEVKNLFLENNRLLLEEQRALPKFDGRERIKEIVCPVCYESYGGRVVPRTGNCGHSTCKQCLFFLPNRSCPICRRENSFVWPTRNYLAREILEVAGIQLDEDKSAENSQTAPTSEIPMPRFEIFDEDAHRRIAQSGIVFVAVISVILHLLVVIWLKYFDLDGNC